MKKLRFFLVIIIATIFSFNAKAQNNADYFPGKWNLVIYGTPRGDVKISLVIERKDGKLIGNVQDSTGKQTASITAINEKDKNITVNYTDEGYAVDIAIEQVDADDVKGILMGSFDVKGTREKSAK